MNNHAFATVKKLGRIFNFTGEAEEQLEVERQRLCKHKGFEPYGAFQRLDRAGKGYVSAKDIADFLK